MSDLTVKVNVDFDKNEFEEELRKSVRKVLLEELELMRMTTIVQNDVYGSGSTDASKYKSFIRK